MSKNELVVLELPADLKAELLQVAREWFALWYQAGDLVEIAQELRRMGHQKLGARLKSLAENPPEHLVYRAPIPTLSLPLSNDELEALGWIANRYELGRDLYNAYNDRDGTFEVDAVIAIVAGTAAGYSLVGAASGSLKEKLTELFAKVLAPNKVWCLSQGQYVPVWD